MLCSQFIFIKVLSDDFADVDFREELCYHSRPKKAKFERGKNGQKTNVGKQCAAGKAAADPKRFSGDGSATAALSGSGFPIFFRGVGLSAAARSAAALVYDKLTHNCHIWKTSSARSANGQRHEKMQAFD